LPQRNIPDVKLLSPARFADDRGFFCETWNKKRLSDQGIDVDFVQDNHSLSFKKGIVRGLHFQFPPFAQDKLVRCGRGRLYDVVVDIRQGSPTFGDWMGEELSFENGKQYFIPKGFLHGFITLEDNTEIIYKCSNYYARECDCAVRFDDPDLAIDWPLDGLDAILSDKDEVAPRLNDLSNPFEYTGP
jgi:dTDP-4-dehydrorhamnose 3,5-epimerase